MGFYQTEQYCALFSFAEEPDRIHFGGVFRPNPFVRLRIEIITLAVNERSEVKTSLRVEKTQIQRRMIAVITPLGIITIRHKESVKQHYYIHCNQYAAGPNRHPVPV